jgi:hypothetical protein
MTVSSFMIALDEKKLQHPFHGVGLGKRNGQTLIRDIKSRGVSLAPIDMRSVIKWLDIGDWLLGILVL